MIKNSRIDLSLNSKQRIEYENVLRYTLLLDIDNVDVSLDDDAFLNKVKENTKKCCINLFKEYNDTLTNYNFFGNSISGKDDLLFLSNDPVTKDTENIFKTKRNLHSFSNGNTKDTFVSLTDLLIDDTIMQCYHCLITDLFNNECVHSYQIINNLNNYGPYAILKKQKKELIKQTNYNYNKFSFINRNISAETKRKNASNFNKMFLIKKKVLPALSFLQNEYSNYYIQFSQLLNKLNSVQVQELNNFLHADKKTENSFDNMLSLSNKLTPSISSFTEGKAFKIFSTKTSIVDNVYDYYITEKIFGLNLIYSLLNNIHNIDNNTNFSFHDTYSLNLLKSCLKLPNAFSRTYFLHFAFNHIKKDTNSYIDFWRSHDMNRRNIFVSYTDTPHGFHLDKWLKQFDLFCTYFSDYAIPIYCWCFTSILMNSIEKKYPKQSHAENLISAIEYLAIDIQSNYSNYMRPISIAQKLPTGFSKKTSEKLMDGLDIITKKEMPYRLSEKFSLLELDSLIQNHPINSDKIEMELNIKPLSLDIFKKRNDRINMKDVQSFYLDRIFSGKEYNNPFF